MSRIGRMPIAIPAGVTVEIAENNHVTVKGPKGTLERTLPSEMDIKVEGSEVVVTRPNDLKKMKSLHGLTRTLINNTRIRTSVCVPCRQGKGAIFLCAVDGFEIGFHSISFHK